jgi:hypothetical protein
VIVQAPFLRLRARCVPDRFELVITQPTSSPDGRWPKARLAMAPLVSSRLPRGQERD